YAIPPAIAGIDHVTDTRRARAQAAKVRADEALRPAGALKPPRRDGRVLDALIRGIRERCGRSERRRCRRRTCNGNLRGRRNGRPASRPHRIYQPRSYSVPVAIVHSSIDKPSWAARNRWSGGTTSTAEP